jgi:hypothetical protein
MLVVGDLEFRSVDEGVIWSKEGECNGEDDGNEYGRTQTRFQTSLVELF